MFSLEVPLHLGISHDCATIPSAPRKGFVFPVAETHVFQTARAASCGNTNHTVIVPVTLV